MQTNGPTNRSQPTVAVVGAGISGLTCARTLADHGLPVTVFEKSRGVGGRMATRRSDNGVPFDHGAQYFTVRDERFQSCVDSWQHAGLVQRWTGRIVSLHDQNTEQEKSSTARFVACPGMNAICRHLAENLDVRTNTRVAPPTRCQGKWLVSDETGSELGRYDVVIVSAPLPRLESFFRDRTTWPAARRPSGSPAAGRCWSSFPLGSMSTTTAPSFRIRRFRGSPETAASPAAIRIWKPGFCTRPRIGLSAISKSHPKRSRSGSWMPSGMRLAWRRCPPATSSPTAGAYALPTEPLPDRYLFDGDLNIGACGDWCAGPRVEGAFLSGAAVAERLLGLLTGQPAKE